MIESGWAVVDRSGRSVGRVEEVTGDADKDIFDGLRLAPDGGSRFIAAEHVARIETGRVELDVEAADLASATAEAPGGAEMSRDRSAES